MKHITRKQFLEHGWKKGDKVLVDVETGYEELPVTEVLFDSMRVYAENKHTFRNRHYTGIYKIIPAKSKKGTMR